MVLSVKYVCLFGGNVMRLYLMRAGDDLALPVDNSLERL